MKKFCLIGQNIKTSLSPLIHNSLFKVKKMNNIYQLYKQGEFLPLQQFQNQNIQGISITIPFKQKYKKQNTITYQKGIAQQKKIINTLRRDCYGKFLAYNTDIFGISQCLKKYLPNKIEKNKNLAILIGAGATAQIFSHYFNLNKTKVVLINRSIQKMNSLAKYYQNIVKTIPIMLQSNKKAQFSISLGSQFQNIFFINTLPTNAVEKNMQFFISLFNHQFLAQIQQHQFIFMDVNYRDKTQLLKNLVFQQIKGRKKQTKAQIVKGLDMLIWQAIQQNRFFCQEEKFNEDTYVKQFQYVKEIIRQNI